MSGRLARVNEEFGRMQGEFGASELDAICGGGCVESPRVVLVFMNPTKRNVAATKSWQGIKAPWIGTKDVWGILAEVGLFKRELVEKIRGMRAQDWTEGFAGEVYDCVAAKGCYVTNLAKCTQVDARELPNEVFERYRDLFFEEMRAVGAKKVVLFGNQVSSVVLGEEVMVSKCRRRKFEREGIDFYAVYYPVGNGRFNVGKAVEDLGWILEERV